MMSRGLVAVASVLNDNRMGWAVGRAGGGPASLARPSPRCLFSSTSERPRCRRVVSAPNMLTELDAMPKTIRFSYFSLGCCSTTMLVVVVMLVLTLIKNIVPQQIFLLISIVVVIILLVCVPLVIFQTKIGQRRNADEDDSIVGVRSLHSTLVPLSPNLVATTHRVLNSRHIRRAHLGTRTAEASPLTGQTIGRQSPLPLQSLIPPARPSYSSPLRTVVSAPSTPCSTLPVVTSITDDTPENMQRPVHQSNEFRANAVLSTHEVPRPPLYDNPPPYHVAIHLPVPETVANTTTEPPPPSYESAMN